MSCTSFTPDTALIKRSTSSSLIPLGTDSRSTCTDSYISPADHISIIILITALAIGSTTSQFVKYIITPATITATEEIVSPSICRNAPRMFMSSLPTPHRARALTIFTMRPTKATTSMRVSLIGSGWRYLW